jgi:hypothetical protein
MEVRQTIRDSLHILNHNHLESAEKLSTTIIIIIIIIYSLSMK